MVSKRGSPAPSKVHVLNAPKLKPLQNSFFFKTCDLSGRFFAPRRTPGSETKRPMSAASTGRRSGSFGTLEGATGGTQTHSRRTDGKLGRLQRARQELVRVPESNTKYGGNGGKPGGHALNCCRQVSVSPQGFPSEKNCFRAVATDFAPLFTGQLFIVPKLLPDGDSRKPTEIPRKRPVRHAVKPMV